MLSARMLRKALILCLTLAVLLSGFPVSFTAPPLMHIQLPEAVESRWWRRRPLKLPPFVV
ncbi:MAG: hypothetical protein RBT75_13555 [Anaerolineae bacterium]|jgi:hypothetical protein|nr:hypothetical protein [Anaerolineae bacterium]